MWLIESATVVLAVRLYSDSLYSWGSVTHRYLNRKESIVRISHVIINTFCWMLYYSFVCMIFIIIIVIWCHTYRTKNIAIWWCHQMETFSVLPTISPYKGQWRSFDVFCDLRLNKRLSKQTICRWFGTPSRSFWRHCNDLAHTCVFRPFFMHAGHYFN